MEAALAWWVGGCVLAWALLAAFSRWLLAPGLRDGDLPACATYRLFQVYSRLVHRLHIEGGEHLAGRSANRPSPTGRPLLVVSNHTAGVDPMLIQAAVPFEVRWVMAQDMRAPALHWLWEFGRIIFVERDRGADEPVRVSGWRDALRHLKRGGVLGVFPEGYIERPARRVLPFGEGVGLLVARTGAEVLPVIVEGTPQSPTAWGSLARRSHSRVRLLPPMTFEPDEPGDKPSPARITRALREVFLQATGWPANDQPPVFRDGQWWYVDEGGAWMPASQFGAQSA